ncbi:ABC transporter permease [Thermodesulfobacteriota bacterium]
MMKRNYQILRELTINEFRLQYRKTLFGYVWSVLAPLMMLATLCIAFSIIMRMNVPHYQLFVILGMILWNFFSESTSQNLAIIRNKASLIGKINFPKELIIISSVLAALVNFMITFCLFFVAMAVFKVDFSPLIIVSFFYIIPLVLLSLGFSFALSAYNIFHRDLEHLWRIIIYVGFWLTPIIYPQSHVAKPFRSFYALNPMARIINEMRDLLIYHTLPPWLEILQTFGLTTLICAIGYLIFAKRTSKFVEML